MHFDCTNRKYFCSHQKNILMKLLQKPSEIEINNNKDIYESFCMAIIGRDLNLLKELLNDRGRFLNRSKMEFLGYINSLISSLPKIGICDFEVKKGISLDQVPGALFCEIIGRKWTPFSFEDNPFTEENSLDFENSKEIKFSFGFSLVIEDDEITHVFRPKKIISLENSKKLTELN
jgi:hypothetical protein